MASGKHKQYNKDMSMSHKAYFATQKGFLKKGETYLVSYEVTPADDEFVITVEGSNQTTSKMSIMDVKEIEF